MKRKILAMLLTGALSLGLLAGCSNNNGPAESSGGGTPGGNGEVTEVALKVWCPANQVETGIMEQQQKAFEAAHPEWKITWTTEIVGEDKCQESVLKDVDAAADVFMFASDQLPDLVGAGAIAQLGGTTAEMVNSTMDQTCLLYTSPSQRDP